MFSQNQWQHVEACWDTSRYTSCPASCDLEPSLEQSPPEGDGSAGSKSEVFSAGGYIAANPEDEPLSGHKIHHKIHKTVEDDSEDKQEEEEKEPNFLNVEPESHPHYQQYE